MAIPFPEGSMLERVKNFYWNTESIEQRYNEEKDAFSELEKLGKRVINFFKHNEHLSPSECLELALRKVYDMIKKPELFCGESPIAEHAYEAYVFIACISFVHTSKRTNGMSITEFVKKNSSLDFENPDSPSFRQPSLIVAETDRMRKARQRRLKQARVYPKNTQWNAMPKDSEYEWTRYYDIENANDIVRDTDKRIGNLYKDIRKAIDVEQDAENQCGIENAYKKFLSKLGKVIYEGFLEDFKYELTRICADTEEAKRYFGINLYRLERRLQPYKIIDEVKRLTECNSPEEEIILLLKTVFLDEICFPKIYKSLLDYPIDVIQNYAIEFLATLEEETVISNLVLDKLIDEGFLGEDWYTLFLDKINAMAVEVFYDPSKVEFFKADDAQEKFRRILHAGVLVEVIAYLTAD